MHYNFDYCWEPNPLQFTILLYRDLHLLYRISSNFLLIKDYDCYPMLVDWNLLPPKLNYS